MNTSAGFLHHWLALLNRESTDGSGFAPDVVVDTYPTGRGGECRRLDGLAALQAWAARGPHRYAFTAGALQPTSPIPHLPQAHTAWTCTYQVSFLQGSWQNQGRWTFHLRDQRIVAVEHVPEPLAPDATIHFAATAYPEQHLCAHHHDATPPSSDDPPPGKAQE